MANYHLGVQVISRGKDQSFVNSISYICGRKLTDQYNGKTYYNSRNDVLQYEIFMPVQAPPELHHLQSLCDAINKAEKRKDAQTAREFIGSLPNELSFNEQIKIVDEFVNYNFISQELCAVAAIHEGKNVRDPKRNNPHVHIIVPTRSVDSNGFNDKKNREWNRRKYINLWRENWANVQNQAYKRNGMNVRVSHESLEVQGIDREPTRHLSHIDWQREQKGERTIDGDRKRAIKQRNEKREHQRQLEMERAYDFKLFR